MPFRTSKTDRLGLFRALNAERLEL